MLTLFIISGYFISTTRLRILQRKDKLILTISSVSVRPVNYRYFPRRGEKYRRFKGIIGPEFEAWKLLFAGQLLRQLSYPVYELDLSNPNILIALAPR